MSIFIDREKDSEQVKAYKTVGWGTISVISIMSLYLSMHKPSISTSEMMRQYEANPRKVMSKEVVGPHGYFTQLNALGRLGVNIDSAAKITQKYNGLDVQGSTVILQNYQTIDMPNPDSLEK